MEAYNFVLSEGKTFFIPGEPDIYLEGRKWNTIPICGGHLVVAPFDNICVKIVHNNASSVTPL